MPDPRGENPDIATCVARQSGAGNLVFCLSEHQAHCRHALSFGEVFFCRHPESGDIVARTVRSGQQPAGGK